MYRLSVRVFWIVSRIRNGCNMLRAYNYGPIYKYTTTAFFPNYRYIVYIWNIFITFYLPLFQTKWISIQLFEPLSSHNKKYHGMCYVYFGSIYVTGCQCFIYTNIKTIRVIWDIYNRRMDGCTYLIFTATQPKRLPWYAQLKSL